MNVNHFVYLKYHSIQTCFHHIIDNWNEVLNDNEKIAVCFLDISKFFDGNDHDFLIQRRKYY